MGQWTVQGIAGNTTPLNGETFGHNVNVRFKLLYSTSRMGKYTEPPLLEWNEQIYMIEHHNNQWWEFATNMYKHNPLSKTLEVWAKRYIIAYDTAFRRGNISKGSCQLLTKTGSPLPPNALKQATSGNDKADAVRSYLKTHGGVLQIEVHDIPSINRPDQTKHKERLLVFDCGVAGSGMRFKGTQYLAINGAVPQVQWTQTFDVGTSSQSLNNFLRSTNGIRKNQPPPIVSAPRQPLFAQGECW